MKKLSVGIPTYNGAESLPIVLEKIYEQISQQNLDIDVVVSDNASGDDTKNICNQYKILFDNLKTGSKFKYCRNAQNIGYDLNVDNVVSLSDSEYVWCCSDNEVLSDEFGLQKIINYLSKHDVAFLFLDHWNEIILNQANGDFFEDSNSFFQAIKLKSGLISNCVFHVPTWKDLNMKRYDKCLWIHFAYQIEALAPEKKANAGILYDKIFTSVPTSRSWGSNGTFLLTGLAAVRIFHNMYKFGYRRRTVLIAKKVIAGGGYVDSIVVARNAGLKITKDIVADMHMLYREFPNFYIRWLPALIFPLPVVNVVCKISTDLKFVILLPKRMCVSMIKLIKRIVKKIIKTVIVKILKKYPQIYPVGQQKNYMESSVYGKIYFPYYNGGQMESITPNIFNADGRKMDVWFIRDVHGPHCPYRDASKYFLWDRFNLGLDTHFYTHNSMLETMGTPSRRFGLFVESEGIVPEDYKIFENNKGLWKDFTNIFTYSEKMLNEIPNAKLFTSCATVWYGGYVGGGKLNDQAYIYKEKNISTVCSSKLYTYMHKVRHAFTAAAVRSGLIDVYGEFEGGTWLENKSDSLEKYRFQLVIENDIKPYYFTEKIMDCFASMTVPIYLGATKISDFFNMNGVIVINENDMNNIDKILLKCDSKLYESMIPAVIDNYNRALKYINVHDRLYEEYFI